MFEIELFICIKIDLALNNLQWLICHKTKPNQNKTKQTIYRGKETILIKTQLFYLSSRRDQCLFLSAPGSQQRFSLVGVLAKVQDYQRSLHQKLFLRDIVYSTPVCFLVWNLFFFIWLYIYIVCVCTCMCVYIRVCVCVWWIHVSSSLHIHLLKKFFGGVLALLRGGVDI